MRFMMIVIPKGYENAAPDAVPSAEAVAKMMEYNKRLKEAGALLSLDGLFPPSTGARISFADGKAIFATAIARSRFVWDLRIIRQGGAFEAGRNPPACRGRAAE